MKEIQNLSKDQIALVKQVEIKKNNKLVGRIKPRRGHTVFEVNLELGTVEKAKYKDKTYFLGLVRTSNQVIQINENCIYESALNKKNLLKKLKRQTNG